MHDVAGSANNFFDLQTRRVVSLLDNSGIDLHKPAKEESHANTDKYRKFLEAEGVFQGNSSSASPASREPSLGPQA